jgi:hypothetical protein
MGAFVRMCKEKIARFHELKLSQAPRELTAILRIITLLMFIF